MYLQENNTYHASKNWQDVIFTIVHDSGTYVNTIAVKK